MLVLILNDGGCENLRLKFEMEGGNEKDRYLKKKCEEYTIHDGVELEQSAMNWDEMLIKVAQQFTHSSSENKPTELQNEVEETIRKLHWEWLGDEKKI